MNEQEIQEAIKIIREPIVVNSDIYHIFDQENYNKLQQVYDNCQWFINNEEQIMQNAIDNKKKIDQLTNNWNELERWLKEYIKKNNKWYNELSTHDKQYYGDSYYNTNYMLEKFLNKLKELKGGINERATN